MKTTHLVLAAAAVFACAPAHAATTVLRIDGVATGARTVSRCGFEGPSCADEVTPLSSPFSFDHAFDDADWVDGLARFEFGHYRASGWNSGYVRKLGGDAFAGLDYSYLYSAQDGRTCTTTCVLDFTRLSAASFNVQQIIPVPVPEPSTWAMLLAGFGGIGYSLRARRRPAAVLASA